MKLAPLLPLISLTSAFVITESEIFETIDKLERSGREFFGKSQNVLDYALERVLDTAKNAGDKAYHKIHDAGCDVESWLEGSPFDDSAFEDEPHRPPHHGPPDHPPHRGPPDHHPPHHEEPHHPPHHHKPNLTVYQLISSSKYTTKLAKLIDEYDDLVETLNSTKANFTIFAPTDKAFEKIPKHHKKPSKEQIKDVLLYHISDHFYPAGRVLHSYTIPTLYNPEHGLGHAQRLTVRVTLKGPAINFYSKIVAVNIFGTNGVIHGVDNVLVPPPKVAMIIDLLPGEFSTLELGFGKTGLWDRINNTDYPHEGGTLFAPSNLAFKKLGPKINAFLFSKYGEKYLKALLEYHMVVNQTLYSDAFYDATSGEAIKAWHSPSFHLDLPTVLKDRSLAVDVARYGPFVEIKINDFSRVTIHDGVASDGVIQVVSNVLIPPKKATIEDGFWKGEEMSVEEFKERLEPFLGGEDNMEL
ncbi:FAS1 domain-containing protein [Lojkania enalia]|uniref:FAS1 domain-containing protein n=1 Tax=Lojkania enalia TaxID=147567 RepID=A0A9P4JZA5_9PLEO|nr:FAS1 domain-containing protein [Didymosphaeria enalia]